MRSLEKFNQRVNGVLAWAAGLALIAMMLFTVADMSLRAAMSLAISLFDLRVDEALQSTTRHAAKALGLGDTHGELAPGRRADFVCWDAELPADLVYWFGGTLAREVVSGGSVIHTRQEHG